MAGGFFFLIFLVSGKKHSRLLMKISVDLGAPLIDFIIINFMLFDGAVMFLKGLRSEANSLSDSEMSNINQQRD